MKPVYSYDDGASDLNLLDPGSDGVLWIEIDDGVEWKRVRLNRFAARKLAAALTRFGGGDDRSA